MWVFLLNSLQKLLENRLTCREIKLMSQMLLNVSSLKPRFCCWFCTILPLHCAAASRVKPTGQVQLSPPFTRPGGQPQPVPFSSITWLSGHRGASVELGETVVVKEAANVKNKRKWYTFRRNWRAIQKKKQGTSPKKTSLVVGVRLGMGSLRFPMAFSATSVWNRRNKEFWWKPSHPKKNAHITHGKIERFLGCLPGSWWAPPLCVSGLHFHFPLGCPEVQPRLKPAAGLTGGSRAEPSLGVCAEKGGEPSAGFSVRELNNASNDRNITLIWTVCSTHSSHTVHVWAGRTTEG